MNTNMIIGNTKSNDSSGNEEKKARYASNKPKDCRYCYYWAGRGIGCKLGEDRCYYRLPDKQEKRDSGKCKDCPYGRVNPCIGYCLRDIMSRKDRGECL